MKKNTIKFLCCMAMAALLLAGCAPKSPAAASSAPTTETTATAATPAPAAAQKNGNGTYAVGEVVEDFTVTLMDGQSVKLSDLLKEKKLVMLNFWATWCGYCITEFPTLQQGYLNHADDMALIALSTESKDTPEVIAKFQKEYGLENVPMGQDTDSLFKRFGTTGLPTSVIIDRNGVICLIHSGFIPSLTIFENVLSPYLADDYTEQLMPEGIPPLPFYEGATSEEIATALGGVEGFAFEAQTDGDRSKTFLPAEDGDGLVTTLGENFSVARLTADFTAEAGDVVAFDLSLLQGETDADISVYLDDEPMLRYSNDVDDVATGVAIPTTGEHDLFFVSVVEKGAPAPATLRLRNMRLLTGAEAAAYPLPQQTLPHTLPGHEMSLAAPADAEALQIYRDGKLMDDKLYLYDHDEAEVDLLLGEELNEQFVLLNLCIGDEVEGFAAQELPVSENGLLCKADRSDKAGYLSYYAYYNFGLADQLALVKDDDEAITYLEESYLAALRKKPADEQVEVLLQKQDGTVLYRYSPEAAPAGNPTVRCVDENGKPVADATVQICSGGLCLLQQSDENGEVALFGESYPYTVHVLTPPEGYEAEKATHEISAPGQTVLLTLTKVA